MAKTNTQINKEAANSDVDSPAVIAYRLGQVESAVKDGFAAHDKKLDSLITNFATKEELQVVQSRLNDYQWYFRALVTAVFIALCTAAASLISKKGV